MGIRLLSEEKVEGEEFSLMSFCDGKTFAAHACGAGPQARV